MASVIGTFVPTYQGLSARDFVRTVDRAGRLFSVHRAASPPVLPRAERDLSPVSRAARDQSRGLTVLAPDYNSGNEILAMRAAGATLHYCPVRRDMTLDPDDVERHCRAHNPDLLYVIHYAGWPQPMTELVDLCRRRGMLLVEDCALSLLSETDGRPLGSFGDWSVFCLYKTLPLPNGALLVQNGPRLEVAGTAAAARGGIGVGARTDRRIARAADPRPRQRRRRGAAGRQARSRPRRRRAAVRRANVGDIGFNLDEVDLAMSRVSQRLLTRFDYADIRRRRVENYRQLAGRLRGEAAVAGLPERSRRRVPALLPGPRSRQARHGRTPARTRRGRARVLERQL